MGAFLPRDGILGDDVEPVVGDELGNAVVDERVDVIGATHQQDNGAVVVPRVLEYLLSCAPHLLLELSLCLDGRVVRGIQGGGVEPGRRDVLDQVHPLTPVVERGQRPDHRHHRVGILPVVLRRVGQVLDFADHVVAEVVVPLVADHVGVDAVDPDVTLHRAAVDSRGIIGFANIRFHNTFTGNINSVSTVVV